MCAIFICTIPSNIAFAGKTVGTLVIWPLYIGVIFRIFFVRYKEVKITPLSLAVIFSTVAPWILITLSALLGPDRQIKIYDVWRLDLAITPAFFFLCTTCSRDKNFINRFANLIFIITIIAIFVEFIEVIDGTNPISNSSVVSVTELGISDRGGLSRARSTFTHPLVLDQFFAFSASFLCYLSITSRGIRRFFSASTIPVIIIASTYTVSRTSVMVIIFSIFIFYFGNFLAKMTLKNKFGEIFVIMSLTATLALISISIVPLIKVNLFESNNESELQSTNSRIKMHEDGIKYIIDQPLGYGYAQAERLVGQFTSGRGGSKDLTVDDYFLRLSLNAGIISSIIMLVNALILSASPFQRDLLKNSSPALAGLVSSVTITWVITSFIQSIGDIHFIYYSIVGVALGTMMRHQPKAES